MGCGSRDWSGFARFPNRRIGTGSEARCEKTKGATIPEATTRVLISYSHDSPAHEGRVLDLADRLREDGVDAMIDQYISSPPQGWPAWCEAEIRKADFVLMVCTESYLRRVNGEEEQGKGYGVHWEARLIRQHLYDDRSVSHKFVPVLLAEGVPAYVPTPVKGATIYQVETAAGYEALLRLLTDQPMTPLCRRSASASRCQHGSDEPPASARRAG
jgi:hypothetical protein